MKYFFAVCFVCLVLAVKAQETVSYEGLNVSIKELSLEDSKQIRLDLKLSYSEEAADSSDMFVTVRLMNYVFEAYSSGLSLVRRNGTTAGGETAFHLIPYREIDLPAGEHPLQLEISVGPNASESYFMDTRDLTIKQPKRYVIEVQVNGGEVSPLTTGTWDPIPFFGKKSKSKPDPQWWVYIDKRWTESSAINKNSFKAPDANFRVVLLDSEQLHIKLFDQDNFINMDDKIGTFRIRHPELEMENSQLNLADDKVKGVNISMQKYELLK